MKKTVLLLVCFFCATFAYAQEKEESISPIWVEAGLGLGRTYPPILVDASGKTYGEGDYWTSYDFLLMRSLPKSFLSLGGFLSPHHVNHNITVDGRDYTSVSYRWMIGPAIAAKTTINQKRVIYIVAGAGVKWDIQNKELKSIPYVSYCQNAFSPVAALSATYAFRSKYQVLDGMGIRASVYSYGKAKGIKVKDPLVDSWEISVCWYLTKKGHTK